MGSRIKVTSETCLLNLASSFTATKFDWNKVKDLGILNLCSQATVPPSMTCGRILSLTTQRVTSFRQKLGLQLCVFKVGVTSNPLYRFAKYRDLAFTNMWLVWVSDSVDLVHMLEASLIQQFYQETGCRNKGGTGGEGSLNKADPPSPPYFVYVTGGRADQLRRVG